MSSGVEAWVADPVLLALIDTAAIRAADAELAAAEEVCRRAAAELDRAHDAAAAASAEFEQLRRRAADGMAITSAEIANIHRATVDAGIVKAFRSDALDAARTAREAARAAHAGKIAQAHANMGSAAIAERIKAARMADLAGAVYAAPTGGDEGRRIARQPGFDRTMSEAKAIFEGASAALWRSVRAGWRGCPENFTSTWPVTETIERQQFGRLRPTDYRNTLSPAEKLELVRRHVAGVLEAARRLAQHDAVQERARVLRKKAEQVLGDNDLNRVPALVAELSTARAAFEELAMESELVSA